MFSRPRAFPSVLVTIIPLLSACGSLSEEEEIDLNNYKYNSKLYYERGDFIRAEIQCRKGLALEEDDVSLNPLLGFALLRQQSYPKVKQAETHFERICDEGLYPREFVARLGLASAQHWLAVHVKNEDESRKYARDAAKNLALVQELNQESIEANLLLGQVLALEERYEEALEALNAGLEQLASQSELWDKVASTDKFDKRQPEIELDIRINTARQREFRALKGNILHKLGRLDEAKAEFEAMAEVAPLETHDVYNLARLLDDMGQSREALEAYDRFLKESESINEFVREVIKRKAKLQVEVENADRRP